MDTKLLGLILQGDKRIAREITELKNTMSDTGLTESGAIVQTASGESIVARDSSDDGLKGLRVFGKSEQFSTSGANLFDMTGAKGGMNGGITVTLTKDGGYTFKGTAEDTTVNVWLFGAFSENAQTLFTLPAGTYQTSGVMLFTGISCINSAVDTENPSIMITLQRDVAVTGVRALRAVKGKTYDNIFYPMIARTDTAIEWEPYTGGIPSPNPNFPQPINSAGNDGEVEVGVYCGNLLDYNEWSNKATCFPSNSTLEWKDNGATITSVTADAYTSYSALGDNVYKVPCKPNTTYTLSWEWSGNTQDAVYVFFNGVSSNNKHSLSSTKKLTFTTPEDTTFFTFRVGCYVAGTTSVYKNVQINPGGVDFPFEQYHKQTLTALTPNGLPGIKVTDASLATYTDAEGNMWCADEIDFERGVYVKRIYEHEFSGNESFELHHSDRLYYSIQNNFVPIYGLCTIGMCEADKTQFGGTGFYFVKTNTYSTVNELKAYLKEKYENGNPVKALGILKTPIETSLTAAELNAYKALHTNCPVTTVLNDSGAHMELTYNADTKNYIDNKFTELTNAILSMGGNV